MDLDTCFRILRTSWGRGPTHRDVGSTPNTANNREARILGTGAIVEWLLHLLKAQELGFSGS